MKRAEMKKRLDRLEKLTGATGEIEDLREADIAVYGISAIEEIEREEGLESLIDLLTDPDISESVKSMIAGYLRPLEKTILQEETTNEKSE